MSDKQCACGKTPKLILTCSGAADVGEIADRAARQLHREGAGKIYCLAGIGAGLNGFIDTTRAAGGILAIDGCSMECAKKTLEKWDIKNFEYLRVTDLVMEKGKTPVTEELITNVAKKGNDLLKVVCA
jgi:uncharacterized metal-binding protein